MLSEATWGVLTCHGGPGGECDLHVGRRMAGHELCVAPARGLSAPGLFPSPSPGTGSGSSGSSEGRVRPGIVCWVSSGWTLLFCTENQPRRLQASLDRPSRQAGWPSRPFPCQHSWAGHAPLTGVIGEASFSTGPSSCWWRGGCLALGCLGSSVGEASSS